MFIITRGDNGKDQVRKFVKDEIVKELTDMTHSEIIKDAINNLYGVKMTDDEIKYCEADEHDKNVRANNTTPSTLWDTHKGDGRITTSVEKYADKIEQIKRELGIPKTGAIEVRYHKHYTRTFENVVKYEEDTWFGIKTLFITDSAGRRIEIPMASIKEYVVDMPNDKKTVKEKITLDKEELESIIAEMRALEEKLKKIKEG